MDNRKAETTARRDWNQRLLNSMADEPTSINPTDDWDKAIVSAVEVIRGYAVMMENGEVPEMRATLALLNVARVIESTPRRKQP